jgi:hypothetical protein
MSIAKGTAVTQVVPAPFKGTVVGYSVDSNTGEVLNLVNYTDAQGNDQHGYFLDSQLTAE